MDEAVCAKCITDPHLQDYIQRIGVGGDWLTTVRQEGFDA
jgi:hypothetical protein